ncbi:MAG: hypothetical protein CSA15_12365 [Candidatus Delongbacteria bacterium]|nr:MAG: hypothetical protein CSA15_12365 [Candidatus Delongbacteria bacterium]
MKKLSFLLLALTFSILPSNLRISSIVGENIVGVSENRNFTLKSGSLFQQIFKELESEEIQTLPFSYSLEQNYPNPFNPTTTIRFSLPVEQNVKITVYNILGKEVAELVNRKFRAGINSINFDGSEFASGQYLYKINAGTFTKIRKMLLIK